MIRDPKTPAIFEVDHREKKLRVRCHFLNELSRDDVILQTKQKADEVLQNLANFEEQARTEYADSLSPKTSFSMHELAMIDANEAILYLYATDTSDQIEIHVKLNDHLQFESSELIIP